MSVKNSRVWYDLTVHHNRLHMQQALIAGTKLGCVADCDTCRWMAPSVYSRIGDMTAVHAQPSTPEERLEAYQALLACPT